MTETCALLLSYRFGDEVIMIAMLGAVTANAASLNDTG